MSSPNKNPQRKEVIFKSSIFLSLLLFSILIASYLARGTPPQTTDAAELNQYYAYCYDTADKLAAKLKSSNKDHYGRTWSSYGASVDPSKRFIVPKSGKEIDLTTLCNGKVKGKPGWEEDKKTIPFRYYFWVKPAKIRSSNTYYHTQKFVATYNKLTDLNCWQHQSKGDGVEVPRIEVATESTEFLKTIGVHNPGELGLDMFLVNFQNVYEKSKTDIGYDLSNGYIYFHSVAEVFTNGVRTAHDLTNSSSWLSAAGWLTSNDIVNHYNQYVHFGRQIKHNLRFFRIQTTDKSETTAKLGDYSDYPLWSTGEKEIKVYDDSVLELKGIKTYKKDNKTYYLKGIRICNRDETDTDKGHFYILTNTFKGGPLATREGADKKTDKYCKSDGSGHQLDKLSEKVYNYSYKYKFQFTKKDNGTYKFDKEVLSKDPGTVTNPKNPGKKGDGSYKELDWDTLADHMPILWLKTGSDDQDVYLIYEAQNKGQVKVQKAFYDHTDESETDGISSYEKVEEDKEPKVLGEFKADDNTAKYSIKDAITLERRKIIDNTNNNLGFTWNQYSNLNDKVSGGTASQAESDKFADWNEQIRKHRSLWSYHNRKVKDTKGNTSSERYYARRLSVKYTSKKTGEKVEANIGGDVKSLDALLSADSDFKNAIWSGKSNEAKALADSILKVLRAFEFDDVDKSKELLIKIDYYQSKVQYKALSYIEYMKEGATSPTSKLISEGDVETTYVAQKADNENKLHYGKADFPESIDTWVDPSTGEYFTESELTAKGIDYSSWATKKLFIKKTGAYKGTIKGYHNQSNNSWLTPEGNERKASNVMDKKKKLASHYDNSSGKFTFQTVHNAALGIAVYTDETPQIIFNIHYGNLPTNSTEVDNPVHVIDKSQFDKVDWYEVCN